MEEEDNKIVKWAQEDVETSYNLLNNNNYACVGFIRERLGICTIKNTNQSICGLFNESLLQTVQRSDVQIFQKSWNHCKILGNAVAQ